MLIIIYNIRDILADWVLFFYAFVQVSRVIGDVVHNHEENVRFLISNIFEMTYTYVLYHIFQKTGKSIFLTLDSCSVDFLSKYSSATFDSPLPPDHYVISARIIFSR